VLAIQYLILCTIRHTLVPDFQDLQKHKEVPVIEDLMRKLSSTPTLLDKTNLQAVFLDLDFTILGASKEEYDVYAKGIRKEYESFSWEEYRKGRTEVLQGFLDREQLYFTQYFHEKFDSQARENITREINSLKKEVEEETV
jgi:predicted metal-dependent HD superfamily phosphohydrolase